MLFLLLLALFPMRTISTDNERLLTAEGGWTVFIRAFVKDVGGTFRDLTTYPGENLVLGATWREDIDSPGYTAEIRLRRQVEQLSANPLMQDSPLNRGFNPAASYAALIDIAREVKIEWSLCPLDSPSVFTGQVWNKGFHGYIDTVKFAGDEMVLECSDQISKLRDTWIERERVYSFAQGANATKGCYVYENNTAYAVGDLVIPSQALVNLHFYKCTTAGTTGATEVLWLTGAASTTTQGTAVFTEQGAASASTGTAVETIMQQIIDDHVTGGVTLYVPTSPSWNIRWFQQQRQSVMEALKSLAEQIGWDIRWKWDNGTGDFRLTLWSPDRAKTTPDRTWGAFDQPVEIDQLEVDIKDIRNAVKVRYSDSQVPDANGIPTRKNYTSINSTSITNYGRRFMEVEEDSNSNIDTGTEAQTFADNMCSDLALPIATHGAKSMLFPFAELGDLYQYAANDQHYSVAQKFAVTSIQHQVSSDEVSTSLAGRGKVAGGYGKWLKRDVRARPAGKHADVMAGSPGVVLTATPTIGGTVILSSPATAQAKHAPPAAQYEYHLGTSSGFTPASSTLIAAGAMKQVQTSNLIPGATYYAKVVPLFFNAGRIVRGLPSQATSFIAGRGSAGHLKSEVQWGRLPLNGGFETQTDVNAPPDFWEVFVGTWGTQFKLVSDGSGKSGGSYIKIDNVSSTAYQMKSALFDVEEGQDYDIFAWAKWTAGTGRVDVLISEYDYTGTLVGTNLLASLSTAVHASSTWFRIGAKWTMGTTTKFAKVTIGNNSAASGFTAYFDSAEARLSFDATKAYATTGIGVATTTSATFATLLQRTDFKQAIPGKNLVFVLNMSCYSQTNPATVVEVRLKVTYKDGSTAVTAAQAFYFNNANEHLSVGASWVVAGDTTAHNGVTVDVEWRRVSGTGTISTDANDSLTLTQVN